MIRILCPGKVREPSLRQLIDEYIKRISGYDKIVIEEVADEKIPDRCSQADKQRILNTEGERILKKIRENDEVIVLDLAGEMVDSVEFAARLDLIRTYHGGTIDFVIGGSLGTSETVRKRANWRWKLSDLTFPHQLTRLIILEQIYRGFKILSNETYHK